MLSFQGATSNANLHWDAAAPQWGMKRHLMRLTLQFMTLPC